MIFDSLRAQMSEAQKVQKCNSRYKVFERLISSNFDKMLLYPFNIFFILKLSRSIWYNHSNIESRYSTTSAV